jgi:rhomboid family GlyGly-CTERM serine protease
VTFAVALAAVAIRIAPSTSQILILDPHHVLSGQLWRLWTGHLVHFGSSHLFWNLAVFVVTGAWAEILAPRRTRYFLLLAPPLISLVLIVFEPGLLLYGGLSGIAVGTFVLLAWLRLASAESNRWFWRCALALLAAKIVIESYLSGPIFARISGQGIHDVPLAHIAGAVAATAAFGRRVRI